MVKVYNTIIRIVGCIIPIKKVRKKFKSLMMIKKDAKIKVGKFTYYGNGTFVGNRQTFIGKYTSIAGNVTIGPGEHPLDKLSTSPYFYILPGLKKIEKPRIYCPACSIGNDVWIGQNVFIRAGVPARIIKYRFPKNIIDKLLKYKWWDLPDSVVAELPFDDINATVQKIEELRNSGKYSFPKTIIARTFCLGNFTMDRLDLSDFQIEPFHKNRVDYCLDILDNPNHIVDRNDALKYVNPELHVFLNPQSNNIFECDNVKMIIMDSFTDLTDKMFVRKKDNRQFTMLYRNIDHTGDFDEKYECTGMIPEKDIEKLYNSFFGKLIKTYGDIPVLFLEFSSKFDERPEFISREKAIHEAITKVAEKYPNIKPIQMDIVESHESDDYPYHYSEHTYDMLAKKIAEQYDLKLKKSSKK